MYSNVCEVYVVGTSVIDLLCLFQAYIQELYGIKCRADLECI